MSSPENTETSCMDCGATAPIMSPMTHKPNCPTKQGDRVVATRDPRPSEAEIMAERARADADPRDEWLLPGGAFGPPLLSADSKIRKDTPLYSGCLKYFPLALAAVAQLSKAGNDKHNPGQPLHWSRHKSNDHADCAARHLVEAGTIDADDGHRHTVKLAWRALAMLQLELEGAATPGLPEGPALNRTRDVSYRWSDSI